MKGHPRWGAFFGKRVRFGGYATLLTVIVIGFVIGINLLVDLLALGVDMSESGLFTLSAPTRRVLDGLGEDVRIFSLSQPGKENKSIDNILASYRAASNKVIVQNVDPSLHPGFVQQYEAAGETINLGDLVVVGRSKHVWIDSLDLVVFGTGDVAASEPQLFTAEQQITGAITRVTGATPLVGVVQGHGERTLARFVQKSIESENFEVRPVSLTGSGIPPGARVLMIAGPQQDLAPDEVDRILRFLETGGGLLVLLDLSKQELPRLQSLIDRYGVAAPRSFVVESDDAYHTGNRVELLPAVVRHRITDPLIDRRTPVLLPFSRPLAVPAGARATLSATGVLVTSKAAWARTDLSDPDTTRKNESDLQGPFALAVASIDTGGAAESRVVVTGSVGLVDDALSRRVPGNLLFLQSSLDWLAGRGVVTGIAPRSLVPNRLRISAREGYLLAGVVVILLPGGICGLGLAIWRRRRHR